MSIDQTPAAVQRQRHHGGALRLRLEDLPEYVLMRQRFEQILGHAERQAAFLAEDARSVVLQELGAALDAELRRHMEDR